MRQDIIYEVLRKIKAKPGLMRKVKIFAVVGVVGFVITGALVIWAGVSAFKFVASKTTEVINSPTAIAQVENLKLEANGLPKLQPLDCWVKAQSLMAVEPWLARPALDNLKNLKVACLDTTFPVCEGHECTQMKKLINTAKGGTI
jgi:hypothetical protein